MARVTGSHLICKALKLEGVKNIFGLAGDHILPVLDVMADQDFRIIDTRHEQAAVHMADAWSRITEQPGVCMYTTPGFANAIPTTWGAARSKKSTRSPWRHPCAKGLSWCTTCAEFRSLSPARCV
jgi:thiamine pyrophosphate-dependent acetolactate synthase large subunit-like protein